MPSTQDELVIALQQSVSRMDLPDDGPDLAVVRRRGTARRHRRRASAVLCAAGVVGAVAAGVVVGVPDRPARDDTSAASIAPATSSRAQAEQVMDDVLTRADVGHGEGVYGPSSWSGTTDYVGWNAFWPLAAEPDLELSMTLWPLPPWDEPSPCDPGTVDADPVRGCVTSPLPDGGSVEVYEVFRYGFWDEAGPDLRWEAWVPVATATYADGRRITADVGPAFLSRGAEAIADGVPSPADVVSLDQLRAVVSDPALTTLGVPPPDY